jgi:curli production assembly/transport component CsgE
MRAVVVIFAVLTLCTGHVSEVFGQKNSPQKAKKVIALPELEEETAERDEIILSGIVLDRTISRFGKEFVRQFNLSWQEVPDTAGVNLVIKETKLPRSGTRLVIEVKGQIIYQTYFGMRQKPIEDVVKQATYYAIEGVARANVDMSGPDLAKSGY